MGLFGRRDPALPPGVAAALDVGRGDRVLAWDRDALTGAYVVASLHALHHVPAEAAEPADSAESGAAAGGSFDAMTVAPAAVAAGARARWTRRWLDVAAGAWEPKTHTLSVTWADGGRAAMWTFEGDRVRFPSVFHDRVRTSVYVSALLDPAKPHTGQVALRRDFATGELLEQVTLRKGLRADDSAIAQTVAVLLADLRDQAGL